MKQRDTMNLREILPFITSYQDNYLDLKKDYLDTRKSSEMRNKDLEDSIDSISSHFFFQFDTLQKYLQNYVHDEIITLSQQMVSPQKLTKIGADFLKLNKIFKPQSSINVIPSIAVEYWATILNYLKNQEQFNHTFSKIKGMYLQHLDRLIEVELKSVPIEIDEEIKSQFRKRFYASPLSFQTYLELEEKKSISIENQNVFNFEDTDQKELEASQDLRKKFEEAIEKKKNVQMKEKQDKTYDNYESYFEMSERELERVKRQNTKRRKYSKKSRRRKF